MVYRISLLAKRFSFLSIFVLAIMLSAPTSVEALRFTGQAADGPPWCGRYDSNSDQYSVPNSWSANINAYGFSNAGNNCFRLKIENTGSQKIPEGKDVRFAVQTWDMGLWGGSSAGTPRYTNWATDGGGWSSWATQGYSSIDGIKVRVQTRDMPSGFDNKSVDDIRLSVQVSDSSCRAHGPARSTPWNNGWSSWATDSDSHDPDCIRIKMESTLVSTNPPEPTILSHVTKASGPSVRGWSSADNVIIDPGDNVELSWGATNDPDSCTGSSSGAGGFSTGGATSGEDDDINEPDVGESMTYTVTCTNGAGSASDSVTVSVNDPTPTADLKVRKVGDASWSNSLTIDPEDDIEIGWNQSGTTNTTSCDAVSGFSTGGSTSGIDSDIDEPIGDTSTTYRVICYNAYGTSASDSVTVTTNGGVGASLSCTDARFKNGRVRRGTEIETCWELGTNDPNQCSIKAGSVDVLNPVGSSSGTIDYPVYGEVTFTLDCVGGDSDSFRVQVIPEFQET